MSCKSYLALVGLFSIILISAQFPAKDKQQPSYPIWPDIFTVSFDILVEQYGPDWKSTGKTYYHWPTKSFRADFIDWCLPLFDSGPGSYNNYSCSFVATKGNMYFVNTSTSSKWDDSLCCTFESGLGAITPDWVKNMQYNGTNVVDGVDVDVWWFPGTSDPNKPCYGYWDSKDDSHKPVRFFGLSSIGPTILNYYNYLPGNEMNVSLPFTDCSKQCEASPLKKMSAKAFTTRGGGQRSVSDDWPSCE